MRPTRQNRLPKYLSQYIDTNIQLKKMTNLSKNSKVKTNKLLNKNIGKKMATKSKPKPKSKSKSKTKSKVLSIKEILEQALTKVHSSSVPDSLPCRDYQFNDIYNFATKKLFENEGG